MIKSWGFINRPDYSGEEFRANLLIGYPFPLSSIVPAPISTGLENLLDLFYFRSYLGVDKMTPALQLVPAPLTTFLDMDISYFRSYLGKP